MKVFLSSTAQDLVAYRQVADDTILRLQQQSVVMERFGPLSGSPIEQCERLASESDVVICIVAHRYGFVPEPGKGSITEREVRAAHAARKTVLVWIVDDTYPWIQPREQDRFTDSTVQSDPARVAEVLAAVTALGAFKTWLRATFVFDTFTTPDELGRKISIALQNIITKQTPHVAAATPKRGEIRIVHALQPAQHFHGRDALVKQLIDWIRDLASPDRVWALVAIGGTGKTAIVERVVSTIQPGEANVLVWSFYERPDADAFLLACNELFLGEEHGSSGGRLERLERGLRDGRPHLIVLDGLELMQEDAGGGHVRGELSDHTLKLLLRMLAAGLGRARALITSRFPLIDLQNWTNRGYHDTRLDDLTPEAAVAVLRGWGVVGDDAGLRAAAAQVGHHALSVAVIGSYLRSFASGRIEEVVHFKLDEVTGEDPQAAKLARILAFYAERLPTEEREVLARLSVFPRGVSVELLANLIDAGGDVAGLLLKAKPRLMPLLTNLKGRGLVFEFRSDVEVLWTAHPFLREQFRHLLDCPPEKVFDVMVQSLGSGLKRRPATKPSTPEMLDRYERLIEVLRLAGREKEAFELYWDGLGHYENLLWTLGEYQRGYRILAAFSATGRLEDFAPSLDLRRRGLLVKDLSLYAQALGRLDEAWMIRQVDNHWLQSLRNPAWITVGLINSSNLAFDRGRLVEARMVSDEALAIITAEHGPLAMARSLIGATWSSGAEITIREAEWISLAFRAAAMHGMGNTAAARADFAAATRILGAPLEAVPGYQYARHLFDLGDIGTARAYCNDALKTVHKYKWNELVPYLSTLLARMALSEGNDPTTHIDKIRAWTARTGEMMWIIEAHGLSARHLLTLGDLQGALSEAEAGLLHAVSCGYRLLRIELLIALARISLDWPDPPRAIQAAREALDLSTDSACQYAWGEADAAQVWGEAFLANHEPELAQRAFTQALAVRRRIEHPGVAETEQWLARVGGTA